MRKWWQNLSRDILGLLHGLLLTFALHGSIEHVRLRPRVVQDQTYTRTMGRGRQQLVQEGSGVSFVEAEGGTRNRDISTESKQGIVNGVKETSVQIHTGHVHIQTLCAVLEVVRILPHAQEHALVLPQQVLRVDGKQLR